MTSYKAQIHAMCKSCIHDPTESGTWVEQVTMCTATDCPLWPVRPKIKKKAKRAHEKVVRLMQAAKVDPETIDKCVAGTAPKKRYSFASLKEAQRGS